MVAERVLIPVVTDAIALICNRDVVAMAILHICRLCVHAVAAVEAKLHAVEILPVVRVVTETVSDPTGVDAGAVAVRHVTGNADTSAVVAIIAVLCAIEVDVGPAAIDQATVAGPVVHPVPERDVSIAVCDVVVGRGHLRLKVCS